ncbi:MAG: glycosyltransferase family 4 protein [Gemmatimonadota bacterium]|nr:glycosyltransferase family 4 protein [Gemmatimonadota bacterium]
MAPDRWARDATRDPLRIAVVGTRGVPSAYSGLETVTENLYSILAERGHQVTVYCRPDDTAESMETYRGMRRVRVPVMKRRWAETISHVGASLAHVAVAGGYDLVHMQALAPGLFTPLRALWRTATVASVQGLDWQRAKWQGAGAAVLRRAERSIVRHIDDVTVVSRDLQAYFRTTYGKETVYIPNGVHQTGSETRFDPTVLARFDLARGQYVVYVGRLVPEKRVHDLVRAFRRVKSDHRLVLVGEGGYTDEYVTELRMIAADDPRVIFTGRQEGATLAAVFSAAAAFVTPSELEGLPCALLECMEYGVPAIVSEIPPHRELLGSISGYDLFFPVTDVDAIADRLRRVLDNPAHVEAVAKRAQAFVRREYSWSAIADRTEELFRSVLARRRSQAQPGVRPRGVNEHASAREDKA